MVLPVKDGVYGVQAGHSPVLVAIHMGMLKFTVDGETREILVGDGIAEVTPTFVLLLVDSAERPEDIDKNRAEPPASAPKSACSISRACTSITRPRSLWTAPCSVCRPLPNTSDKKNPLCHCFAMPPLPSKVMLPLSKALHEFPLRGSWRTKCD